MLIVGLGNPGDKYINTRHNLGFAVVDEMRRKLGLGDWEEESKFKCEILKSGDNFFIRPTTFMNLSGLSIAKVANFYKIKPEDVIVIHDELDLPLGHIKIKLGGSGAGHHGIESIMESLGTDKFIRVRLGIGTLKSVSGEHKHASFNAEKFVVEEFMPSEKSKVKAMIKRSLKAVETVLESGVESAQNQFHDHG